LVSLFASPNTVMDVPRHVYEMSREKTCCTASLEALGSQ
jgi:hypothetical protein